MKSFVDSKRLDLENVTLNVAAKNMSSFFLMKQEPNHNLDISGFEASLLKTLSTYFNFSYQILLPEAEYWGEKLKNGSWTGMVGLVVSQEADIGLSSFSLDYQRSLAVDYSFPYFYDQAVLITRNSEEIDKAIGFLKPFSWVVWVFLLLSSVFQIIFTSFILKVMDKCKGSTDTRRTKSCSTGWKILQNFIFKYSYENIDSSVSLRITAIPWWLLVITVSSAYTGQLTGFITIPLATSPIDSLEDLLVAVEERGFEVAVFSHSNYAAMLSKFPEYKQLFDTMVEVPSAVNAFQLLVEGRAAFMTGSSIFGLSHRPSSLHYARESIFTDLFGMIFTKGSTYKDHFDRLIVRFIETGMFIKWIIEVKMSEKPDLGPEPESLVRALRVRDFRNALISAVAAVVLAFVLLLIEVVLYRLRKSVSVSGDSSLT